MNKKYEEIINLPHHVSRAREPMSRSDRAAQFAPYSALSGYEDAVEETARLTSRQIELDEYEKERINAVLTDVISSPPGTRVAIIYFEPDKSKSGGSYIKINDEVVSIDEVKREITTVCGKVINIDYVIEIIIE